MMTNERAPEPGELCECGRPAATVFVTEQFGDVPWCGRSDGGAVAPAEPTTEGAR